MQKTDLMLKLCLIALCKCNMMEKTIIWICEAVKINILADTIINFFGTSLA